VNWSVFGPAKEFEGSPLSTIGRKGLFEVRSFEKNRIAVFDRVVSLVGSHNLGPRSEKLNSETAII